MMIWLVSFTGDDADRTGYPSSPGREKNREKGGRLGNNLIYTKSGPEKKQYFPLLGWSEILRTYIFRDSSNGWVLHDPEGSLVAMQTPKHICVATREHNREKKGQLSMPIGKHKCVCRSVIVDPLLAQRLAYGAAASESIAQRNVVPPNNRISLRPMWGRGMKHKLDPWISEKEKRERKECRPFGPSSIISSEKSDPMLVSQIHAEEISLTMDIYYT